MMVPLETRFCRAEARHPGFDLWDVLVRLSNRAGQRLPGRSLLQTLNP